MASSPYDVSLNATVINQIMSLNHKTNGNAIPGYASGLANASAMFQGDSPHKTQLSSTDLATILALNTSTMIAAGLCIYGNVTSVPFRLRADCGTYASGASHQAIQCSNTLAILDTISAKVGGESAKADLTLHYKSSDGITPPCSVVGSQSLSDASFNGEYLLHSVYINDVLIPELQGVDVQTGLKVTEQKSSGVYPTAFYITESLPTISIQTENVAYANSVIDAAGLGTGINIYFAKRKSGGIVEALADAVHIRISAAVGLGQAESIGGEARGNSQNTVRINPLSLTAAVAIAIA